jgi:hypothetical protein
MVPSSARVAIITVRTRLQRGEARFFSITWTDDVIDGQSTTVVASTGDDVIALVRHWLEILEPPTEP